MYGINNCKAVVTNSYHATIFSIIFKKPFLCFVPKNGANARFDTLKEIFNIKNRINLIKDKIVYVKDKDILGYDSSNDRDFQFRYWKLKFLGYQIILLQWMMIIL